MSNDKTKLFNGVCKISGYSSITEIMSLDDFYSYLVDEYISKFYEFKEIVNKYYDDRRYTTFMERYYITTDWLASLEPGNHYIFLMDYDGCAWYPYRTGEDFAFTAKSDSCKVRSGNPALARVRSSARAVCVCKRNRLLEDISVYEHEAKTPPCPKHLDVGKIRVYQIYQA